MKTIIKEISNNKTIYLILLIIFILGFFFRFYNFPFRYSLGGDNGRDVIMARVAAKQFQLPLTGSFSSIGPITFGPWYYYILIISQYLIPSVWAPWISIGFFSLSMIVVMFLIGRLLIDYRFGLILASLTAFSPPQIDTATAISQHSLVGHFTAYAILIFLILLKNNQKWLWSLLLGFVLGLNVNMHYQALTFLLLPAFLLFYKEKWRYLPYIFIGFLTSMIPLFIFETNNHWFNTGNIIQFVRYDQYKIWTSNRWLTYLNSFWPSFWTLVFGTPRIASIIIFIASFVLMAVHFIKRRLPKSILYFVIHFLILLVMLRYWRGEKSLGYLQFFHPYLYIFFGYVLYWLIKTFNKFWVGKITVILFCIFMISRLPSHFTSWTDQKLVNDKAMVLYKKYPGEKFSIYRCGIYQDSSYDLLLRLDLDGKFSPKGRKIGIPNNDCIIPAKFLIGNVYDFNKIPTNLLNKNQYYLLTPEVVYEDVARWWFKIKP